MSDEVKIYQHTEFQDTKGRNILCKTEVTSSGLPNPLTKPVYEGRCMTAPQLPNGQQAGPPMRITFHIGADNLKEAYEAFDELAHSACVQAQAEWLSNARKQQLTAGVRGPGGRN